jgi:hypothetical protein
MAVFRYDTSARWFKGNTHIHSVASDGGKTVPELTAMYAGQGYDFLFLTDHWVASDFVTKGQPSGLLWIDGIELDGKDRAGTYYHVVCLGRVTGVEREMGLVMAMEVARSQGALLVVAHPFWTGNSLDEAARWGFDGVEIYNHVCHWLNGKSSGLVHWNHLLAQGRDVLGLSVDDAHIRAEHPGWNGAWVKVNAGECTREAIQQAIRRGNFYSSQGPEIRSLRLDRNRVVVESSPVQFARLVGPGWSGARVGTFDGRTLTTAAFDIPPDWSYAYLEIEDTAGRRAWTNPLFTPGA